jgi:hypothetical protein
VKVSLLQCAYLFAFCTPILGCGDGAEPLTPATPLNSPYESAIPAQDESAAGGSANRGGGADDTETENAAGAKGEAQPDCADLDAEDIRCGQISLTMKGAGSSCQLVPTLNDLTLPPRSVRFDCQPLERGPNGYDFDELGHVTLTGDTCAALHESGPHRLTLILACTPS